MCDEWCNERTGQIYLLMRLVTLGGRLDELLQAFVVDVFSAPLRNLIPDEIASELHDDGAAGLEAEVRSTDVGSTPKQIKVASV